MAKQVFVSYTRADREQAERLVRDLRRQGLRVWFDRESLLPGQNWQHAIDKAIKESDFFLAVLSANSVDHRGFVQSEIQKALLTLATLPPNKIFLIPARLNACEPNHSALHDLHWVDLFPDWSVGVRQICLATRTPGESADEWPPAGAAPPRPGLSIDEVFGMQRGDTQNYVERESVDYAFLSSLTRRKHVTIYGCSKQGKTALRRRHISDAQSIVVTCDPCWNISDLFAAILKTADKTLPPTAAPIDVDAVVDILNDCFLGDYIVIEEFHYLSENVQKGFAFKLKKFHEDSKFTFIIVGVWLENDRLITLNPDLAGRTCSINADNWLDEDLIKVIRQGERLLNIAFPEGFAERVVKSAAGSLYIVRETCYRACDSAKIFAAHPTPLRIEKDISVGSIIREVISKELPDYTSYVLQLASLQKREEDERYDEIKRWAIFVLLSCTYHEMAAGVSVGKLRTSFRQKHPQHLTPTMGQIKKVLQEFGAMQKSNKLLQILDFDEKAEVVRYADKGFLLWRKNQKRGDLEEFLYTPLFSS